MALHGKKHGSPVGFARLLSESESRRGIPELVGKEAST